MTDFLITEGPPMTPASQGATGAERPFVALMWVEGRWTGDGRFVMPDAVTWDGLLPIPLTVDHEGVEETIGRVDTIERLPGATAGERFIVGRGVMGLSTPLQVEMEGLIGARFAYGVSMELDAMVEGGVDEGAESLGFVTVVESARVRALSVVTTAAFAEAHISFDDELNLDVLPPALDGPKAKKRDDMPDPEEMPMPEDMVVIAAAGHTIVLPKLPPAEWFQEPTDVGVEGALTITDEGRVYGYLAPGNVPYSGVAGNFTAPMGAVNYRDWMRGETVVAGGQRVVTGNITMGCGHGDPVTTNHDVVRDHYDNSCSLFAKVAAGENQNGVWVAGALYPGVTGEQVERAMGLSCSGHWLPSLTPGYRYDLLAALLVPVPGFAMARRAPSVTMRDGSLAASAVPVRFEDCGCGGASDLQARSEAFVALLDNIEPIAEIFESLNARVARLEREAAPAIVASLRDRIQG